MLPIVLRAALDDAYPTVVLPALRAVSAFLLCPHDEAAREAVYVEDPEGGAYAWPAPLAPQVRPRTLPLPVWKRCI